MEKPSLTLDSLDEKNAPDSQAPEPSPIASTVSAPADKAEDKSALKALLAEARNTKTMIEDFSVAIKNASFQGREMIAVAKGVSFLDAILNQNKAHVENLQMRLDGKAEKVEGKSVVH